MKRFSLGNTLILNFFFPFGVLDHLPVHVHVRLTSVSLSQVGAVLTSVSVSQVGAVLTNVPLSQVGAVLTNVPLSQVGAVLTSVPLSQVGAVLTSVPLSQVGTGLSKDTGNLSCSLRLDVNSSLKPLLADVIALTCVTTTSNNVAPSNAIMMSGSVIARQFARLT